MTIFRSKNRAFTLIELLVVIVILGILAMFLIPAVTRAIRTARVAGTVQNGKQLYTLLFAALDANVQPGLYNPSAISWPKSKANPALNEKQYTCSSEYFADLISSNVIDEVTYSFFAEDKVMTAKNEVEFRDQTTIHNSWCITLDVSDRMKNAVVLFTQNFKFTGSGSGTRLDAETGLEGAAQPYGDFAGVRVLVGGSSAKLDKQMAILTNFCPGVASNTFLWPLAQGQYLTQ